MLTSISLGAEGEVGEAGEKLRGRGEVKRQW